jgi:hypothetical protein
MASLLRDPVKRLLDPVALHALARGCAVLGAGGGGDTYLALLQALQATEDYGPAALVDVDELPDDALIMPCGGIGAPTVSIEKIGTVTRGTPPRPSARPTGAWWARWRAKSAAGTGAAGHLGGPDASWSTRTEWGAQLEVPRSDAAPISGSGGGDR